MQRARKNRSRLKNEKKFVWSDTFIRGEVEPDAVAFLGADSSETFAFSVKSVIRVRVRRWFHSYAEENLSVRRIIFKRCLRYREKYFFGNFDVLDARGKIKTFNIYLFFGVT